MPLDVSVGCGMDRTGCVRDVSGSCSRAHWGSGVPAAKPVLPHGPGCSRTECPSRPVRGHQLRAENQMVSGWSLRMEQKWQSMVFGELQGFVT